jgi:hypothetical protein
VRPALALLAVALLLALPPLAGPAKPLAASPLGANTANSFAGSSFADWAAVVISGDNQAAHSDAHTETFDNARRDLGRALERSGFSSANVAEFSVEPARHRDTAPGPARIGDIAAALARLTARAKGGCLFYLTSHGSPDGAVLGERVLAPGAIAGLLNSACGDRPTVVVVSACYSGVFVAPLARPNRLVLTAARRDRSSFGCGESDRYPFFDACVLEALPVSPDFLALAQRARLCVARRERHEHMSPPSDPQIAVGPKFHSPRFAPAGWSRRGPLG